jgi:hypothetical protein
MRARLFCPLRFEVLLEACLNPRSNEQRIGALEISVAYPVLRLAFKAT